MPNLIYIVGAGSGTADQLTGEARATISHCRYFAGGPRLLDLAAALAPKIEAQVQIGADLEAARSFIEEKKSLGDVCVLTSGDPGCFSIMPYLRQHFGDAVRVVPGISSVQKLAARLAIPWQDWRLLSLHGRGGAIAETPPAGPTVYFCDKPSAPHILARRLLEIMPDCPAVAAQRLGQEEERLLEGSLSGIAATQFSGHSLLLVMPAAEPAPALGGESGKLGRLGKNVPTATAPGIPDDMWLREEGVPLSKSEVRAVLMSKTQPALRGVIWDIGAGTGTYGIECSLLAPAAQVIAVEKNPAACHLIAANAERFGARVEIVCSQAPEGLESLAPPDLVIVGGNDGQLAPIIKAAARALNPGGRLAVTALLEQTKKTAHHEFARSGLVNRAATRVSIARGQSHEWAEQNPVVIFTGDKEST